MARLIQRRSSLRAKHSLIGNVGRLPRFKPRETRAWSGAGRHVGGQDVVRVAVQVLACSVVPHRGARVGVAGGDLNIAQVNASIEHGRDERVAQHVRVRSGDLDAGGLGEVPQAAGGRVPVHPGAVVIKQDRPANSGAYRSVDGPADRWRQRDQDDLGALAGRVQDRV